MWDILLNDDEKMIAESVRDYLTGELPLERLRPNAPASDPVAVRRGMAELGFFGIGLPEAAGGSGLGLVEEMLVQRECGRQLASPGVLATVLGAHVAHHAGDAALAADLASGGRGVALTVSSRGAPAAVKPVYAFDRAEDDLLLYWNDDGMGLYHPAAFTDVALDECLDDSVSLHRGTLVLRDARHWVRANAQPLALRAQILLAAAQVGLADAATDLAVDYAKVREQFGKPIGSFQAIKHRCADMGVRARLAWYQTGLACLKVQHGAADAVLQAASAKLVATDAARENGRAGIQIHGGIGFQSECDAHWFVKRAHVYDRVGGATGELARRIVTQPSPLR